MIKNLTEVRKQLESMFGRDRGGSPTRFCFSSLIQSKIRWLGLQGLLIIKNTRVRYRFVSKKNINCDLGFHPKIGLFGNADESDYSVTRTNKNEKKNLKNEIKIRNTFLWLINR